MKSVQCLTSKQNIELWMALVFKYLYWQCFCNSMFALQKKEIHSKLATDKRILGHFYNSVTFLWMKNANEISVRTDSENGRRRWFLKKTWHFNTQLTTTTTTNRKTKNNWSTNRRPQCSYRLVILKNSVRQLKIQCNNSKNTMQQFKKRMKITKKAVIFLSINVTSNGKYLGKVVCVIWLI